MKTMKITTIICLVFFVMSQHYIECSSVKVGISSQVRYAKGVADGQTKTEIETSGKEAYVDVNQQIIIQMQNCDIKVNSTTISRIRHSCFMEGGTTIDLEVDGPQITVAELFTKAREQGCSLELLAGTLGKAYGCQ